MNSRRAVNEAMAKSRITPILPNRNAKPISATIAHQERIRWFRF